MFPPENDYETFYGAEGLDRIGDADMPTDKEKIGDAIENRLDNVRTQLGNPHLTINGAPQAHQEEEIVEEIEYGPVPISYGPKERPGIIARWRDKIETSIFSIYSPAYKNAFLKATIDGKGEEQAKTAALSAMVNEAVDKGGLDKVLASDAISSMKFYGAKSGFDTICSNRFLKFLFAPICIIISLVKTVI